MGMWTTAHLAYGVQIPDTDSDELEEALKPLTDGVSYLQAGGYGDDRTFLVTYCENADLGDPEALPADALHPAQCAHWNQHLAAAAEALGVTPETEPSWLLIADIS